MSSYRYLVFTPVFLLADLTLAGAAPAVPEPPHVPAAQTDAGESVVSPLADDTAPSVKDVRFVLNSVHFEYPGMKLDEGEMGRLMQPFLKKEITPAELNEALAGLTHYARTHGYPAAMAYIPEQTAVKGEITLRFEPGRLGKIKVASEGVLHKSVVDRTLAGLKPGTIIQSEKMEESVRNLKDISGVKVTASLTPGEHSGESDLEIELADKDKESYVLYTENYGGRASGRYRYGLQAEWCNISHAGDRLNIGGIISNGKQRGYNIGYELPVGRSATTIGISYSHSDYELGSVWSQLGFKGKSDTISLYGRTPLQNQANRGLNLVYALNHRSLSDEYSGIRFGARHSWSVSLGLDGRYRTLDNALQYNVTLHSGTLVPDSDEADEFASDGGYKGRYTKATFDVTGVQKLSGPFDVMLKVSGQKAASNLDSSERIYLGGARGVRAYPQGEASGDEGILGTLEFRYHTKVPGMMLSVYWDAGHVHGQKSASGSTTLQGWGLGLSYVKENDWFARFDDARRIGWDESLSSDAQSKQRMWFLLGKVF